MSDTPSFGKQMAAFIVICLIWGTSWSVVRIGLETVTPILAAGLRFTIASVILAAIMVFRREHLPRERRFWYLIAYLCFSAITAPFALVYWGQQIVPSGVSSILFATFPFWVALLALRLLKTQRLAPMRIVGTVLGFLGIVVVSGAEIAVEGFGKTGGMTAIVLGAFLQASALVAIIRYGKEYSSVSLNILPMAGGAVLLIIMSTLFEDTRSVQFTDRAVIALVYLAAFSTVLTFVLYYWLAKHMNAILLSFTAFITPLVAVFTGWLFLAEELTPAMLIGTAIVLAGIAIANVSDRFTTSTRQPSA